MLEGRIEWFVLNNNGVGASFDGKFSSLVRYNKLFEDEGERVALRKYFAREFS